MNIFYKNFCLFFCAVLFGSAAFAQQEWPKNITGNNGELIKIYQPQVEFYSGNLLKSRSAISVIQESKTDPVFGAFWWEANVADNGNSVTIQSMQVINIKFPDGVDEDVTNNIKNKLESAIPQMNISIAKDDLQQSLNSNQQQNKLSAGFNNTPPKVIYTTKPSMLILIDGQPKLQANTTYGVDVVVNSPFTIAKNNDGRFYLYGGKHWYTASSATGPYNYADNIPDNLRQIETAVKNNQANTTGGAINDDAVSANSNIIPEIIVSTEPAELIQSDGEANFAPVENTGLLYVKNSSSDIFMDVNSQQYYVLLSGRWYRSPSLKNQWQYIAADKLPADFGKIPAGSAKDNVLSSVAGTEEANEAVMDAAVPQTAKVDRKTATANVSYDGNPEFENISGTRLQYAVNSSITVMKLDGLYYAVDNGVWFQSDRPTGPWQVSTTRPEDVDRIPPSYPVYNAKYVYVYDVTPDYVYMGYTPGYLNAYVYGPTIVYGTGYYYRPWFHNRYYARPYTWGFSMNYTPWYGWGFGYGFGYNWFDIGFGFNSWWGGGYRYGGWWGPSVYRPCYAFGRGYQRNYGYYGYNRGYAYRNNVRINVNYNNNIYSNRRNVYAYNNRSFVNNNRYNNNNRGGSFNNRYRGADGNRYNDNNNGNRSGNMGNRIGNNDGSNNSRRFNQNNNAGNNNNRFNNQNNRAPGNNADGSNAPAPVRRSYTPQGQQNTPRNADNNRTPGNNNSNGFGRRPSVQGQNNTPDYDNNRNNGNGQSPVRQREYNPQRNSNNNSTFSRPPQQRLERPQRSSPSQGFEGGGNGGRRPSFDGGNGGGRSNSGSNNGGNNGGGGNRGGGERGRRGN